ncbi:hypothetical protein YYG_03916 [Plasmodium vinckei petteri]|uniref:B box-type domain-containing protein n=1 Tax=Plasmodium vinckei petteri TaxID=138298 RepID=W7AQD1_PLAVN|nr:hypothetical protein YYG_03916 [Plasmodium vinckei petteri]CAD2097480.1 conserved Plasmodium protein, unknown function [Plasmodium vinckei petteri]
MNEKIVIQTPLFVVPNENKSNVLKYEKDNNFNTSRNDAANLANHIYTNLPYKANERDNDDINEEISLNLNEKENMNCFLNKKNVSFALKNNEKNVIQSYRKGEINKSYNIMENMYDVHYTNKGTQNLNDYLKHVNVNNTAPCIGEFRTCMNCFLNISTLFCKTCNNFLCAICNIKLHKNSPNHIVNVCSSGLYENNYKYNDIILKEKDKWLVELENNTPIKIREKCKIHTTEYIKYACKTCQYTLLCTDCLLSDPIHANIKSEGKELDESLESLKSLDQSMSPNDNDSIEDKSKNILKIENNLIQEINNNYIEQSNSNDSKSNVNFSNMQTDQNIMSCKSSDNNEAYKENGIVRINKCEYEKDEKEEKTDELENGNKHEIERLKPGYKLVRENHEIYTLIDAKNEIKEELNNKLEMLSKKSLVLKNTIPSLKNIYKYGKITCKNNKRSIRAGFTITNNCLEKKKKAFHEHLKKLQDKSTNFLKKLDEERNKYQNYLEKKNNEIQNMVKLSNRNPGLSLDYYVDKLDSFKCLFFTKDNLIDIEKQLEIPHSQLKSENMPSLIEKNKLEILNSKNRINGISQRIQTEFQRLFNINTEIPVYPAQFKNFLQKRMYNKQKIEPSNDESENLPISTPTRRQKYFKILPFTYLYMNMDITYQKNFMRKDTLHQKWELKTVSIRSVYLCIHTHANNIQNEQASDIRQIKDKQKESHISSNLEKEEMSESNMNSNMYGSNKTVNSMANDIESIICLSNVRVKEFTDPDITNITILEKRNNPYGIEITEYNDKNDLVGYWLLTNENKSEIKNLLDIIIDIKNKNKDCTPIPSFHPKINMNNAFFNYNQNNINTIYKHFASSIDEHSYLHFFKNSINFKSYENNDYIKKEDLDPIEGSDNASIEIDNNINLPNLKFLQTPGNNSKNSDLFSQHTEGESKKSGSGTRLKMQIDVESIPKFEKINEYEINDIFSNEECQKYENSNGIIGEENTDVDSKLKNIYAQILENKENKGTILKNLADNLDVWGNRSPDTSINITKKNIINEEKHYLPLNIESNFLSNYLDANSCNNGTINSLAINSFLCDNIVGKKNVKVSSTSILTNADLVKNYTTQNEDVNKFLQKINNTCSDTSKEKIDLVSKKNDDSIEINIHKDSPHEINEKENKTNDIFNTKNKNGNTSYNNNNINGNELFSEVPKLFKVRHSDNSTINNGDTKPNNVSINEMNTFCNQTNCEEKNEDTKEVLLNETIPNEQVKNNKANISTFDITNKVENTIKNASNHNETKYYLHEQDKKSINKPNNKTVYIDKKLNEDNLNISENVNGENDKIKIPVPNNKNINKLQNNTKIKDKPILPSCIKNNLSVAKNIKDGDKKIENLSKKFISSFDKIHKIPPLVKKKKNTIPDDSNKLYNNLKNLKNKMIDDESSNQVTETFINRVLSQIGNKKVGA